MKCWWCRSALWATIGKLCWDEAKAKAKKTQGKKRSQLHHTLAVTPLVSLGSCAPSFFCASDSQ